MSRTEAFQRGLVGGKDAAAKLRYIAADESGDGRYALRVTVDGGVGGAPSGTVDQGAAGAEDWKVTLDGEAIAATQSGSWTVALDAASLAALETIDIGNFPADYALTDTQLRATPIDVDLNGQTVPASQSGSWSVSVDNLPANQTDALTNAELRATDVDVADSGEREYTHITADVSASGDTVVYTPAAGKAVRLRWLYAINDPSADSPPKIKVRFGAQPPVYNGWAISKRQRVTGGTDEALTVNLSHAGDVAFTALVEEVSL